MSILSRVFHKKDEPKIADDELVSFDEVRVVRTMRNGKTESLPWSDLQEVSIVTTDEGPFADDVFWVLTGASGGCAVPTNARGAAQLLERLQQLPGFDNKVVIEAMGSASNAMFVCWRRSST